MKKYNKNLPIHNPNIASIDLSVLRSNFARIKNNVNGLDIWGVVKANAFGHGAVRCGRVLQ
jgi:alanine racemase